jgi:mRNA-degrading endonuclease toxin of MazEF toxin-antitoxin module
VERRALVVPVHCEGKAVHAVTDQIRAVDKTRFLRYIETLSAEDIDRIDAALRRVLGL